MNLRTTVAAAALWLPAIASERPVKMENLPAAVQKTVREQSRGAVLRGLSEEVEKGKTFYEAELKVAGHSKDVLIDAAGSIVETEEEVSLDSIPAAAQAAIRKQAGKGRILSVEAVSTGASPAVYEAKIKTAGRTSEVRVAPDGSPAKEP